MSAFDLGKPKQNKQAVNQGQKSFIPDTDMRYMGGVEQSNDYLTKESQLNANSGWVFKGNDRVASSCADVEIQLFQKQMDGDRELVESGELHDELFELLNKPNEHMDGTVFKYCYYSYLNFNGEFYNVTLGNNPRLNIPYALEILPAHQVQYQLLRDKESLQWYEVIIFDGEVIPSDIVWRDTVPDLRDLSKGMSIIEANALTIDSEERSKLFNRQFFANSARPSLVVTSPKVMQPDQYKRFKQQMDEMHTGIMNAYKPLILEGGATGQPFALSQRDMDFLETRKYNKDEILAMFGVSPAILGMVENVNRSNMDAAKAIFAEYELKGRANKFRNFLNKNLLRYQPLYEFDIVNPVPEDAEALLREKQAAVDEWMTVNEIRAMGGFPPVPGGDVIPKIFEMMQKQKIIVDSQAALPAAQEDKPEDAPTESEAEDIKDEEDGNDILKNQEKAIESHMKESGVRFGKAKKKVN